MTETLGKRCELLVQNRNAIARKFMLEKPIMSTVAGLIFTGAGKEADIEKMTECRKILNQHTGIFSEFKDYVKLSLISKMALSDDPEQYIDNVREVYKKLHKGQFGNHSYMILAAMLICDLGKQDAVDEIAARYQEITKHMKEQHPIITNAEDISYVMLLALSDRSVDAIISDMDECFDHVKNTCKISADPDVIQGLSENLALTDGDIKEKCDKVIRLFNALKESVPDLTYGYSFLALCSLIHMDETAEDLISEIVDAEIYLSDSDGFCNNNSMDKSTRLLFAILLVAETYGSSSSMVSNSFINSAFGIIKAQQIASMISVMAQVLPAVLQVLAGLDSSDTDSNDAQYTKQNSVE